jgi:ACS family glucarate transporter-like MFS transporter
MGNEGNRQPQQGPPTGIVRNPWALVVLLFLTAVGSYLCRVNISVVGALMMRDLGFSQIDMGRLFSAFVLGYAMFQIPAGAAADRWGARLVLGSAAFIWVLATAGMAALGWGPLGSVAVSAFAVLLGLRFILGVFESPTFPASAQGVAQWIAPVHQGFANGIVLGA